MKQMARLIVLIVFLLVALDLVIAQTQPNQKKAATSQKPKSESLELGKSYAVLRPEQKRLIDDFIRHYNATTGSNLVAEQAYDNARLSTRTTFDAVTHALLNAKMTDAQGKSLGRAIDLVEAVDQVMGEESGVGGDLQFRLYVYLKPSGSKLNGGTLSADLAITGPLNQLVISGPVRMSNTKLACFDMGAKLGALSAFSGKAPSSADTTIQNASLNAHIAPEMTRADAINVTIPSLGVVTGAGTISPNGALDFQMIAELQGNKAGALSAVTGRGGDGGGGGVPFRIQGTTSNPSFVADVGGMAASAAKGAIQQSVSGKTGGIGAAGILPRKKPK